MEECVVGVGCSKAVKLFLVLFVYCTIVKYWLNDLKGQIKTLVGTMTVHETRSALLGSQEHVLMSDFYCL